VPKISEARKTERREQILAGARRCFAEYGYEGATVARLESATGLSRGAIFNYFPSKEELFIELAVRDDAYMSKLFVSEGLAGVVHAVADLDPDWISVNLELLRRVRTDASFRKRIEERQEAITPANRARLAEAQRSGEFRDDLEPKELSQFINLVLTGLALTKASGDDLPAPELVLRLLDDAIGGKSQSSAARQVPG
jgi:TetR/AcrR family transcriptional regulator, transcriptional repressor of aconitase